MIQFAGNSSLLAVDRMYDLSFYQ